MTFYQTPLWANGLSASPPGTYATLNPAIAQNAYAGIRQKTDGTFKGFTLLPPTQIGRTNSYWADYYSYLYLRYSPYNPAAAGVYVDFMEVCNEPNLQWWPQAGEPDLNGGASSWVTAGRMITTATWLTSVLGIDAPVPCGPATSDITSGAAPLVTNGEAFTSNLLGYLESVQGEFASGFAWTQHNYNDITHYGGAGQSNNVYAQRTVAALGGRWFGWPAGDITDATILLTEGGYEPVGNSTTAQATNLYYSYMSSHNNTPGTGGGRGIAQFTQYQWWTSTFDSGLIGPGPSYTARPAYAIWNILPSP